MAGAEESRIGGKRVQLGWEGAGEGWMSNRRRISLLRQMGGVDPSCSAPPAKEPLGLQLDGNDTMSATWI